MKTPKTLLAFSARLGAALLSAGLLAAGTPPFGNGITIWFALVPLLMAVKRSRALGAALLASLSGAAYYALSFFWVGAFHRWALPFMALHSGLIYFGLPLLLARPFLKKPASALLFLPALWTAFEFLKESWFLRFPFGMLGYSQYARLPLIQIADLGGVELVGWLIVFANTALFLALEGLLEAGGPKRRLARAGLVLAPAAALAGLALGYGTWRLETLRYPAEPVLKVGFAQTLFPSRVAWDSKKAEYLKAMEDLASGLGGLGAKLVVFPELAVDRPLSYEAALAPPGNAEILNALSGTAKAGGFSLLFGSLELRSAPEGTKTYNTLSLFGPSGSLEGVYRKRALVPFGETNPLGGLAPGFGAYLRSTTQAAQLDRGETPKLMAVAGAGVRELRFGGLICFEGCFGVYAREYALLGADFLVNATSDYWALSPVAMEQHALMSVFRAVETRTPVLRVSNGGLSCYVDERGKWATSLPLFKQGSMTSRLYLLKDKPTTLYVRWGSWFAWLCVGLSALGLGLAAWSRIRGRPRKPAPNGAGPAAPGN